MITFTVAFMTPMRDWIKSAFDAVDFVIDEEGDETVRNDLNSLIFLNFKNIFKILQNKNMVLKNLVVIFF